MFPNSLERLIESFKKLPGVGQKSAERMAFSILNNFDEDDYKEFCESLEDVSKKIKPCSVCNVITDEEKCYICSDKTRKSDSLIVVENSKDVFLLEHMGNFDGLYHVLGGFISPFDDIGPDDINLKSLFDRIEKQKVKEVIFVTRSCVEADTTILYVKRKLQGDDVVISKIANGVPVGADMEYIDSLTLKSALNNRKEVLD